MVAAGADDVLSNLEVPTPPMDTSAAAAADLPHETCGAMRKMSLASADTAEAAFKRTFIAMHANHNVCGFHSSSTPVKAIWASPLGLACMLSYPHPKQHLHRLSMLQNPNYM